jgi:outer membrane lipoprotein-sorting protein
MMLRSIVRLAAAGWLAAALPLAVAAQEATSPGRSYPIDEQGQRIADPTATPTATPSATPIPGPGRPELTPIPSRTPAVTSGTLALLRTLETTHSALRSIHATFHQVRVDEAFLEKIESDGELWFRKPDRFRCDYADPDKLVNLIHVDTFYLYVPLNDEVDIYRFKSEAERDQYLHLLTIGFGFKADDLIARYEIHSSADETGPLDELRAAALDPDKWALFVIQPREAFRESSPFIRLKVYIDKTRWLPDRIWYEDTTSAATMTLQMKHIDLNQAIDDAQFDPDKIFPPDAERIEKLTGGIREIP